MRTVESDVKNFEANVGRLRNEVTRLAGLRGVSNVRVFTNVKNKVPDVVFWNLPAIEGDEKDNSWRRGEITPPELLDFMKAWHLEHPFCRIWVSLPICYHLDATEPWDAEVWRAAYRANIESKKVVKAAEDARKKEAAAAKHVLKQDDASLKRKGPLTKAKAPAKKQATDNRKVVVLTQKDSAGILKSVAVQVVSSPTMGCVTLQVLNVPGAKKQSYEVGDVLWSSIRTPNVTWSTGKTKYEVVRTKWSTYRCETKLTTVQAGGMLCIKDHVHVSEIWSAHPTDHVWSVGKFAAKMLDMKYEKPDTIRRAVLVRTSADLNTLADTLMSDPTKLSGFLNVLENVDDSLVPDEKVFAALHAAHGATPVESFRERIDAVVAKLSAPSAERVQASMDAAL